MPTSWGLPHIYIYISLSPTLSHSLSLSLCISHSLCLSISHRHTLSFSLSLSLSLSLTHFSLTHYLYFSLAGLVRSLSESFSPTTPLFRSDSTHNWRQKTPLGPSPGRGAERITARGVGGGYIPRSAYRQKTEVGSTEGAQQKYCLP